MSSDYQLEDTVYLPFTTRAFATGIPTALVSGAVDIYEDVTATPIITGETLTVSLNSVAGFNMITVTATAATGFGAGQSYTAILQAGTVGGVSVVGEVVAHFTLDMSAAAKDLANGTDGLGALKTLLDTIESQTDDIGVAGAGLTDLGGMSTGMKAEVESEANDALVAQKLDHLVAVADGDDPVDGSIMAHLVSAAEDWSTFVPSTDSLQALRDRGDAAWTTGAGGAPPTTLQTTTIATLASQVSFTLTAGSADNNAYIGAMAVIEDSATSTQKAVGLVKTYTGATKTIVLDADPGVFTMAVGDTIDIIATSRALPEFRPDAAGGLPISDAGGLDLDTILDVAVSTRLAPTVAARTLDVTAGGAAGIDWANVENPSTAVDLSATDIQLADTVTTLTNLPSIPANWLTAAGIAASALDGKGDWNVGKTGYALLSTGADLILKSSTFALAMADAIWDEILTAAEHNVPTSAGRRLRQIEAGFVITTGTAQAGGAASITLASGESSTDEIFQGDRVIIVAGTGIGEHGIVIAYDGTTKVCTMSQNWVITPDATSEYELQPADVDVETWQHAVVSVSATTALPEVDAKSISDDATAADNLELFTENALGADNKILISTDAQDLSATLDVNTKTLTAAAIAAATFAADAITATALAVSAVDEIRDGIMPTQNAAFNNLYFLFVSSGDHVTPVTGAGTMAVTRSIDGSAFASGTGTGPAEVGNGIYQYDASAADMNGGVIQFRFTAASGTPAAPDDAHVTVVTGGGV